MGRPSVLTEPMKVEIGKRLAAGETLRGVSKSTGIAYTTLRRNFSDQVPQIREVAQTLAKAEIQMALLPVSAQRAARTLADQLKGIQDDYAAAAAKGARTANKIADIAGRIMDGEDVEPKEIANAVVAADLHKAANAALVPAAALVAVKGKDDEPGKGDSEPTTLNIHPIRAVVNDSPIVSAPDVRVTAVKTLKQA